MGMHSGLDPDVMYRLGDLISENHRWADIFKQAHDVFQTSSTNQVSLQLTANQNQDWRRCNLPTSDEVAVVVPGDGTDVAPYRRDGSLSRVNEGSAVYECLPYPHYFIYSEDGYHYELAMSPSIQKRLSRTDYVVYRIQQLEDEFSLLLHSGRLFQQYLVDILAAADQNRLSYLHYRQSEIRASVYGGLPDTIDLDLDLHNTGQRFILPSSYTDGPRYMKQYLQDALALAHYHNKIDLFITLTCTLNLQPKLARNCTGAPSRPDRCRPP
jgi:hypothetical protein